VNSLSGKLILYFCGMKINNNSVGELRRLYASKLEVIYDSNEANNLIMLLLEHHFGINRISLALNPDLTLTETELDTLDKSVCQLLTNRPIQYVTGEVCFCEMKFRVDENVLIPRPETEELVYHIKDDLYGNGNGGYSILDIGTGSGCIAVSLAKLLNNCHITAIDISAKALEVAKGNALANRAAIDFIQADILSNPQFDRTFDVIVSNPPYVCNNEKKDMRANVLNFEPATSLFVDDGDPLLFYRQILSIAPSVLKPKGVVWFEINEHFGMETIRLCSEHKFYKSVIIKDFMGKDRFIKASL